MPVNSSPNNNQEYEKHQSAMSKLIARFAEVKNSQNPAEQREARAIFGQFLNYFSDINKLLKLTSSEIIDILSCTEGEDYRLLKDEIKKQVFKKTDQNGIIYIPPLQNPNFYTKTSGYGKYYKIHPECLSGSTKYCISAQEQDPTGNYWEAHYRIEDVREFLKALYPEAN